MKFLLRATWAVLLGLLLIGVFAGKEFSASDVLIIALIVLAYVIRKAVPSTFLDLMASHRMLAGALLATVALAAFVWQVSSGMLGGIRPRGLMLLLAGTILWFICRFLIRREQRVMAATVTLWVQELGYFLLYELVLLNVLRISPLFTWVFTQASG